MAESLDFYRSTLLKPRYRGQIAYASIFWNARASAAEAAPWPYGVARPQAKLRKVRLSIASYPQTDAFIQELTSAGCL